MGDTQSSSDGAGGESANAKPLGTRQWWPLVVGFFLFPLGQWIPLPGVNLDVLDELWAITGPGSLYPLLGAIGSTIPFYVTTQIVLTLCGLQERCGARIAAAGVYLLGCAFHGFALTSFLYGFNDLGTIGDLVPNPGWGFQLMVTLAWTAGAALVWAAGNAVDRTGRVSGPLFLFLGFTVWDQLNSSLQLGQSLDNVGPAIAPLLLSWAALPLCWVMLAGLLLLRPVARWPTTFLRLPLRSPFDLLALLGAGAIVAASLDWSLGGDPLSSSQPGWVTLFEAALTVLLLVGIVVLWWRRTAAAAPRTAGAWASLGFALVVSFGMLLALLVIPVRSGVLWRVAEPGPLSGDSSFLLVLEAEETFADGDAEAMVSRIEALGADAEISESSERVIALQVDNSRHVDVVVDALSPNQVFLYGVQDMDPRVEAELQRVSAASPSRPLLLGEIRSLSGPCSAFRSFSTDPSASSECLFLVEEIESELFDAESECALHCAGADPIVTTAQIETAFVDRDAFTGAPVVHVELTSEGRVRFSEHTRLHVREPIAIVVDERVVSVPVVQEQIPGGRIMISLGNFRTPEEMSLDANVLAESLAPGSRVQSRFRVRVVE